MAQGRKPKPAAVKKQQGNPGKRKVADKAPTAGKWTYNQRPKHLSLIGKEAFADLRDLLGPRGMQMLDKADKMALEVLAETYAEWRSANDEVLRDGMVQEVETKQGGMMKRQHPAVNIRGNAAKRMLSLMAEFGLTPSSRSRLLNNQGEGDDPILDMLSKRNQMKNAKK